MDNINEPQFDEVDLNRLYEALEYQLLRFENDLDWYEEVPAIRELKDRIGQMLDAQMV